MSALLERLRTLHRASGGGEVSRNPPASRTFSLPELPELPEGTEQVPAQRRAQGLPVVPLAEVHRQGQTCLSGSLRLDPDTRHGEIAVGDILKLSGRAAFLLSGDHRLRDFDPTRAAFFDLETAGLMGGSGNLAFLAGVVRVERSGGVVLHQVSFVIPPKSQRAST